MNGDDHRDDRPLRPPPRWMLTFADMMSLLFTLFVMIVSFADFDKRKFQNTVSPIREAFNQYTGELSSPVPSFEEMILPPETTREDIEKLEEVQERDRIKRKTVARLWQDLNVELVSGLVSLEETPQGVILRFPSSTAFPSGGAELSPDMGRILERVAVVLRGTPGSIAVGGHTDDLPIGTDRFRSNWDLSTARAVSVVHNLIGAAIEGRRVAALGYAETRPLAPNDSAANRARNRRVEIELTIETGAPAQPGR